MQLLKRFISEEEGLETVEYAIITGIIVVGTIAVIGLIGLVVYQFMALFNPRPRLELSSTSVPLGGAAELSWSFSGRTDRLKEFTVALSGKESATYRRGTNTYTAHNTFYEMELFKTSNIAEVTTAALMSDQIQLRDAIAVERLTSGSIVRNSSAENHFSFAAKSSA